MVLINTKIIEKLIDFGNNIINKPMQSIGVIIIFSLILIISSCLIYKKSKLIQKIINFIENLLFPLIKRERIILAVFTKHTAVTKSVTNKYLLGGYKEICVDYYKKFCDNKMTQEDLQSIVDKQYKTMHKIKKGMKDRNSLVYLGFPHIPFALLDGLNFSGTDNVILYEYKGSLTNSSNKDFFELENTYNSDIEILSNYENYNLKSDEIILKIEQSFNINDEKIKDMLGDIDLIYLKNKDVKRWGINSYAEVDKFAKEFFKVLQWANDNGVKKIHLFMTTPVSLTFSLGKVIEHYHPKIIVYNYNNNEYDWCIDIKERKVSIINEINVDTTNVTNV